MPQKVIEIPGVGNVEFPASMSEADISKAAAKLYADSQPPPATWTATYPKTAAGVKAVVDALPGIGGIVGGVLSTPETIGAGTIPGVALGVGAGRGLRDLIAEGLGLDRPSTPSAKAGRIVLDAGEAALAQAVMPGLIEAIKTPGRTVREVINILPERLRPWIPEGVSKAPAAILKRPAWQTWTEAAPASESNVPAATTGTSWTPAPMPTPKAPPAAAAETAAAPTVSRSGPRTINDAMAEAVQKAQAAKAAKATSRGGSARGGTAPPADPPSAAASPESAPRPQATPSLSTAEEAALYQELRVKGLTDQEARDFVAATRKLSGTLPTDAEVREAVKNRNRTGRWRKPEEQ